MRLSLSLEMCDAAATLAASLQKPFYVYNSPKTGWTISEVQPPPSEPHWKLEKDRRCFGHSEESTSYNYMAQGRWD